MSGAPRDAIARSGRLLLQAAAIVVGGLAIAGAGNQIVGGVVLLVGWAAFVVALHMYGRSGRADGPKREG